MEAPPSPCHPERSRGTCSSTALSWICFQFPLAIGASASDSSSHGFAWNAKLLCDESGFSRIEGELSL